MTFQIKYYNEIDKRKLSEFVLQNPDGNFYQTPELYEAYTKTKNYNPLLMAVTDDQNNIIASLLAVRIQEFKGPFKSFSSRSVIQGGPLFQDSESGYRALNLLMTEYDKDAGKSALYTEIRNTSDQSQLKPFYSELGYNYHEHLNILVDLKKSEKALFSNLSKTRRRYLRKAKEHGVEIEEIQSLQKIPYFYELLQKTYKNVHLPLADISLFNAAFTTFYPKNMIKIFLAKHNDEYIGGIMTPIYKGVITEWYITGSRKHSKLYPGEAITWHPIKWGSENEYSVFDFGGAGVPQKKYGVRDFKMQFGGELVDLGRYIRIHSPNKIRIANCGYKIWNKIQR